MDHIVPAIEDKKTEQLSAEDLQKLLHSWFDDKGLLTDLRCHLRRQMVEILRNSNVGKSITTPLRTATLTEQAVHLIVAEYLIRNRCHYSLSMFNTEVTLTSNLPEFQRILDSSEVYQNWQFSKENLVNILELNGIAKQTKICDKILSLYYDKNSGRISLLSALIKILADLACNSFSDDIEEEATNMDSGDMAIMQLLKTMLLSTSLSPPLVNHILGKLAKHYNLIARKKEEDINAIITSLKCDINGRDDKIQEIMSLNEALKRKILKKVAENNELTKSMETLLKQERAMRKEYKKLKHMIGVEKADKECQTAIPQEQLDDKSVIVAGPENKDCLLNHCNDMCRDAMQVIEHLQSENQKLVQESNQHKSEINNITKRCNRVLQEYNETQAKLALLSSKISEPKTVKATESEKNEDSSCDSTTDDVIYQARLKLKKLEQETDEIHRRFKHYKS